MQTKVMAANVSTWNLFSVWSIFLLTLLSSATTDSTEILNTHFLNTVDNAEKKIRNCTNNAGFRWGGHIFNYPYTNTIYILTPIPTGNHLSGSSHKNLQEEGSSREGKVWVSYQVCELWTQMLFLFYNYISRFIIMIPFVYALAVTSLSLHISKIILHNFLMTVIKHAHKATLLVKQYIL